MKQQYSTLGQVYRFSSAHRLHSEQFTSERNLEVYGKCNNFYGHGHNYILEVTVHGNIDPDLGTLCERSSMDEVVRAVVDPLHLLHLDKDVPYFQGIISSGENILQYLWEQLELGFEGVQLWHLRLYETKNNYFERSREAEL